MFLYFKVVVFEVSNGFDSGTKEFVHLPPRMKRSDYGYFLHNYETYEYCDTYTTSILYQRINKNSLEVSNCTLKKISWELGDERECKGKRKARKVDLSDTPCFSEINGKDGMRSLKNSDIRQMFEEILDKIDHTNTKLDGLTATVGELKSNLKQSTKG